MSAWPNRVSIGGLVLDERSQDGLRVVTKVTGWGASKRRSSIESKAQQGGGWDAATFAEPRTVGIESTAAFTSPAAAHLFEDELAALADAGLIELTVDNDAVGPRSCVVRVEIPADPEWQGDRRFSYQLQVIAPDHLRYGPETFASTALAGSAGGTGRVWPRQWPRDWGVPPGVTPGAITLANAGTAAYWPRLRIDGPVPNPVVTLVETGDTIRINRTVEAGQWLDIDCGNRHVLLNGKVSLPRGGDGGVSSVGRWLAVPKGGGSLTWTADAADPSASLSVWGFEGAWI